MPVAYEVTVYRSALGAEFRPGGQGFRWIKLLSYQMKLAAAAGAPKRSFELAKSHKVSFRRGSNQYSATAVIENTADHAEYVHGGTDGAVGNMFLPAGGPNGPPSVSPYGAQKFKARRKSEVRGQLANPWLEEACSRVSRSQGAIRIA